MILDDGDRYLAKLVFRNFNLVFHKLCMHYGYLSDI